MKTRIHSLALMALFAAMLAPAMLRAQESTTPPAAPAPAATGTAQLSAAPAAVSAPPQSQEITMKYLWVKGGWCMWPLALCSLFAVGLTIYNGIIVTPSRLLRPDVVETVYKSVRELDFKHAHDACLATTCMIGNIISGGLQRIKGDRINVQSVEKGMEETAVEEFATHLQAINSLSVVATISPMLGLLGTVSGMIKGFHIMALGGMGRPELLADSISEALITTLVGLCIGIPAMVSYFYFKNKFTTIASSVSHTCGDLLEHINVVCRQYADGIPVSEDSPGMPARRRDRP